MALSSFDFLRAVAPASASSKALSPLLPWNTSTSGSNSTTGSTTNSHSASSSEVSMLGAPVWLCGSGFNDNNQVLAALGASRRFSPKIGFLNRHTPSAAASAATVATAATAAKAESEASKSSSVELEWVHEDQISSYPPRESESGVGGLGTSLASVLVGGWPISSSSVERLRTGQERSRDREAAGGVNGTKRSSALDLVLLSSVLVSPGGNAGIDVAASSSSGGLSGGEWWSQFYPTMSDLWAAILTMGGAVGLLQIFNELAKRNILDRALRRKLVHIGVGLVFMLFWPLYTSSFVARYLAAFAPAANTLRVMLVGLGLMRNDGLVNSMSRHGDRRELLKGPLYYGIAVVMTTIGFWRTSPVGVVALINLCAGDGFADLIGRRFGRTKLPHNKDKSLEGTIGFVVSSSLISMLYLTYFSAFGLQKILPGTFGAVVLTSLLSALVESLPVSTKLDDNLTVPFTAMISGMLFLPTK